ncbi:hypothetical protein ACHAQJ_007030 [Trichoderma viride]
MNSIEQAFSASLNDGGSNQDSTSSKDQQDIHRPIHEDEALCNYILSTIKAPKGALSIQESTIPASGSGLFTTRDVAEGELIFTSVPLVLCSEVGDNTEACDFCFQQRRRVFHPIEDRLLHPGERMPDLYKCKGCNLYQYCSQSCWQRAWDTGHLYECGLLAGASTDLETRMLYRLLILLRKKVLLPDQVRALSRLTNEEASYEQFARKDWPKIQNIALEAKKQTKSELDVADILKLYCIIRVNSLPVDQTYRNAPLGTAIDLGGSMLNHCCDPNIVIVFNSTQVEVRAMENIKAGEELLHCYRDIAYDFTFRQPRIAARYQFRCHCARCVVECERHCDGLSSNVNTIPLILATQAELFDVIDEARNQAWAVPSTFNISQHLAKLDKITKTGYAGRRWPDDLEPLPIVLKTLASLCERHGDLVNAIRMRVKALVFTRLRNNLHYSEDLVDFVVSLSTFTMYPNHVAFLDRTLPKVKDFQDVYIGHLYGLHEVLLKFYGEQGRVTRVINEFKQTEIAKYHGPRPTTRAFRRRFKASQETILKWAGLDVKHWTVE